MTDRDSFDKTRIKVYRELGLKTEDARTRSIEGHADIIEISAKIIIKNGGICGAEYSSVEKVNNMRRQVDKQE